MFTVKCGLRCAVIAPSYLGIFIPANGSLNCTAVQVSHLYHSTVHVGLAYFMRLGGIEMDICFGMIVSSSLVWWTVQCE